MFGGTRFVRRTFPFCVAVLMSLCSLMAVAQPPTTKPKLVLLVAIDQFRYNYLVRFRDQYTGGLNELLIHGAVFENGKLEHYPSVTDIGHATMLTGATPALSGIMVNDWYDPKEHKRVLGISDDSVKVLGGSSPGASPRRLLVSTIEDELGMAHPGPAT